MDISNVTDQTDKYLPVSKESLQGILRQSFRVKDALLSDIRITILGQEKGWMSYIFRIELFWEADILLIDQLPKSVVIKVPTFDKVKACAEDFMEPPPGMETSAVEEMNKKFICENHERECNVYEHFRQHCLSEQFPFPRYFYGKKFENDEQGFLIMEDCSPGGRIIDVTEGLELDKVLAVVEILAKWHAYCWQHSDWQLLEYLVPPEEEIYQFVDSMRINASHIRRSSAGLFPVSEEVTNAVFDRAVFAKIYCQDRGGWQPVMISGDMYTHNVIYQYDYDQKVITNRIKAIIDWQMARPGSCMEDIARLTTSSCTVALRRNKIDVILQWYYQHLKVAMGDKEPPVSLQQVKHLYHQALPMAAFFAMIGIPLYPTVIPDGPGKDRIVRDLCERAVAIFEDAVNPDYPNSI